MRGQDQGKNIISPIGAPTSYPHPNVNFDRVAPFYRLLETLVFGDQLQQARNGFVRQIESPHRALVVGEGNGRFLVELLQAHPSMEIDCVEASTRMIDLARARLGNERVRFICIDVRQVALTEHRYDLIVTHFFLDCFTQATLPQVIEKLARAATHNATWLIADFCLPPQGWRRLRARMLLVAMYAFFRLVAGIEASKLVDYGPLLRAHDFSLTNEVVAPNEMTRSQVWQRAQL